MYRELVRSLPSLFIAVPDRASFGSKSAPATGSPQHLTDTRAACQDKKSVKMVQTVRGKLESLPAKGVKERRANSANGSPTTTSPVASPATPPKNPSPPPPNPASTPSPRPSPWRPPPPPPAAIAFSSAHDSAAHPAQDIAQDADQGATPAAAWSFPVPDPAPSVVHSQVNGELSSAPPDTPLAQADTILSETRKEPSPTTAPPPGNHVPPQNTAPQTQSGGSDGAPLTDAPAPVTRVPPASGRRREPPVAPATPVRPRRLSSGESLQMPASQPAANGPAVAASATSAAAGRSAAAESAASAASTASAAGGRAARQAPGAAAPATSRAPLGVKAGGGALAEKASPHRSSRMDPTPRKTGGGMAKPPPALGQPRAGEKPQRQRRR